MRKSFLFLFLLIAQSIQAQLPLPFLENFRTYPSSQVPTGYGGDMKVYLAHGLDEGKAVAAWLTGANKSDSLISPAVGPVDDSSVLSFSFRMVEDFIYPSVPASLNAGDYLEISISTDSQNFTPCIRIDQNNYSPNLQFRRRGCSLQPYAGNVIYFKVAAYRAVGSSDFFADIDSILIDHSEVPTGIASTPEQFNLLYSDEPGMLHWKNPKNSEDALLQIFSIDGRPCFSEKLASDSGSMNFRFLPAGCYLAVFNNHRHLLQRIKLLVP